MQSESTKILARSTPTPSFVGLGRYFDVKYLNHFSNLDEQITKNFRDAKIHTRPVNGNGLWCCLLFPMVLLGYTLFYSVPQDYQLVTFISIGLLVYSNLFILFLSLSCLVLQKTIYGGCIASGFISSLLIYFILGYSLQLTLFLSMGAVYLYSYLLLTSLTMFPKTFTVGEAMVFQQGVVLFGSMLFVTLMHFNDDSDEMQIINAFLFTVLSTVGLIVTALVVTRRFAKDLRHLTALILLAGTYAILVLHLMLGRSAIPRLLKYVFRDQQRFLILCFWLTLSLISVAALVSRTRKAEKASAITRKTFHVLATVVFISGVLYDVTFIKMAASFGLAVIIFVEALRKSEIEPISSALQEAFYVYNDEKDSGAFAITPIYLFAGLALPLALCPSEVGQLELLAGALATGIGDSAAAWAGQRYGGHRWPDSSKTIEGTAFNILSQIATVYALVALELLESKNAVLRTAVAATAVGLVEARTNQVDNLILPLVMLSAFQLTHSLA